MQARAGWTGEQTGGIDTSGRAAGEIWVAESSCTKYFLLASPSASSISFFIFASARVPREHGSLAWFYRSYLLTYIGMCLDFADREWLSGFFGFFREISCYLPQFTNLRYQENDL